LRRRQAGRAMTKYHGRKLRVGQPLEFGIAVDPFSERARDADMLSYHRPQPVDTEVPDHEPELERAKAATERNPVVHEIRDASALADDEIFRNVLKRTLQQVRPSCVENRAVDWREKPLVRIDHHRLGPLTAGEYVAHLRQDRSTAGVRRIDVQPYTVLFRDVGDGCDWIHCGSRSRSD